MMPTTLRTGTGEYGDMLEEGILDPAKVTRLALQNAASIAGLLLTTEVMIAEAPKDDEHAHGGGAPGGMGEWAEWAEWTCKEPEGCLTVRRPERRLDRRPPSGNRRGFFCHPADGAINAARHSCGQPSAARRLCRRLLDRTATRATKMPITASRFGITIDGTEIASFSELRGSRRKSSPWSFCLGLPSRQSAQPRCCRSTRAREHPARSGSGVRVTRMSASTHGIRAPRARVLR